MRRALGIAAVAVIGLLAALLALLVFDTSGIANSVKDRALPGLSQKLGRPVTVGRVEAHVLPRPSAVLHDVRVAGAPGEPEFLTAGRATATVELWPLLRSLGKDIRVSEVELSDTRVNLVRRADGRWNYESLTQAFGGSSDREYVISRFGLRNGALALHDATKGAGAHVGLEQIDLDAKDIGAGRPLSLALNAAFASATRNLEVRLTLAPAADAHASPKVSGRIALKGASLEKLSGFLPARLDALMSGGQLSFDADVATQADGAYAVNGHAQLEALKLRGAPARGGFTFAALAKADRPEAASLKIDTLALQGPGLDVGGSASVQGAPVRARFDLTGSKLDLDQLLALAPKDDAAQAQQPDAAEALVPPAVREQLAGVQVAGTVALGQVTSGALTANDLRADLSLERGVLNVRQGSAKLYQGTVRLDGTRVDLRPARPVWDLNAKLVGVDMGQALAQVAKEKPLDGRADGALSLHGEGNDWSQLRQGLTGKGSLALKDGALSSDLGTQVAVPLRDVLAKTGRAQAAEKVEAARGTQLKDLNASFTVKDGWLQLTHPLGVETSLGTAALSGRIGLDRRLDLSGRIALAPAFVGRVSGGRFTPGAPLEVPLQLGGRLAAPDVHVSLAPESIAKGVLGSPQAERVKERAKKEVQGRLRGLLEHISR